MQKLQIMKNVPEWVKDTPNLLEHEQRQLARQIGEALYDGGYIRVEESEGFAPGFNCEKSIVIKMTLEFSALGDTIARGVEA